MGFFVRYWYLLTFFSLFARTMSNAPSVELRLDSNPENRCMRSQKGAMWILGSPYQSIGRTSSENCRIPGSYTQERSKTDSEAESLLEETECDKLRRGGQYLGTGT